MTFDHQRLTECGWLYLGRDLNGAEYWTRVVDGSRRVLPTAEAIAMEGEEKIQ